MDGFAKRTITVLLSLLLIVYVVYQGFQIFYDPVRTETVYAAGAYRSLESDALVLRNETVISGQSGGFLSYTLDNGSRVAKGGEIAKVYASEQDSRTQQKIDYLTGEITQLQDIQSQGTTGRVNLDAIDKQIQQTVGNLAEAVNEPSFKEMDEWQSRLLALMNKRQVTIGKASDFNDRINALNAQKSQLASSYTPAESTVTSPVAGYFVSRTDGYEAAVSFDKIPELTPQQVKEQLSASPAAGDGAVGKVVGDYKWYLACVLPLNEIGDLKEGSTPDLRLPFVSEETIPSEVVAVNRSREGEVAVIFECTYMSSALSSVRKEPVQILLASYDGLRVPSSSVTSNAKGEQGVYVRSGDTMAFRKVDILYSGSDYVICAKHADDKSYLQEFDDIVVKGKGLYDGKAI